MLNSQEKLLVASQLLCMSEIPMPLPAGTTHSTSGKTS